MPSPFAPPEIMSAYAFAADGSDAFLPKGTHLRIFAGLGASFPLAPFCVFKIKSEASEPGGLHITDRDGAVLSGLNLASQRVANVTLLPSASGDDARTVRIDVRPDDDRNLERVTLLDQMGRVIAERDAPQWMFSAPVLHQLRLAGRAKKVSFATRRVRLGAISGREALRSAAGVFGLPIRGAFPWYLGTLGRNPCMKQVQRGAPRQLNPMDRPAGPFSPVGPADEIARVTAMLAAPQAGGGIEAMVSQLVSDSTPPWLQTDTHSHQPATGAKQFAKVPRLSTLQFAALDAGLARFLGFAGVVDDLPDFTGRGPWDCLAVLGTFAIDPAFFGDHELARDLLAPLDYEWQLRDAHSQALGGGVHDGRVDKALGLTIDQATRAGFIVRSFVAVVAPVPPWLPPSLPKPQVHEVRWQQGGGTAPSSLYRAGFAFEQPPLAFLCAVAREAENHTFESRHQFLEVGDHAPDARATPRMLGHEVEPTSRRRLYGGLNRPTVSAGLVSEQDISAHRAQVRYRFAASDFFGRFGPPTEATVTSPPRPAPPSPVLRYNVEKSTVDPMSTAKVSPGDLTLTVAVGHAPPASRFTAAEEDRLASAILVPALDDLAAGALRIKRLKLTFGTHTASIGPLTPGITPVRFPLPPLDPQEKRTLKLSAVFFDEANTASASAEAQVRFVDPRPPKVFPSGIGLFWTSTPGPASDVELKLTWSAAPQSLHRVYLTDQHGLGLSAEELHMPGTPANVEPSKGRVAQIGAQKVLAGGSVDRKAFQLLTDPPVKTAGDGRAIVDIKLPRSLSTVQFLRVVPLTDEGLEAPFDRCGVVPVAVPESHRPAAPQLDGKVDAATGTATLTISTSAFNRAALQREEPGLFTPGVEGNEPPRFRLRRVAGAVPDPIYAREIANGALKLDPAASPAGFSSAVPDDNGGAGLEPFVRYAYWAEVRLPPERNLPAGVAAIAPPGGISPLDPASAKSHSRPMSLPSAPRVLMRVPPERPDPLSLPAVTVRRQINAGAVTVSVTVANPPRAHPKAVKQFRLAAWAQWKDQPIELIGTNPNSAYTELGAGPINLPIKPPVSAPLTAQLTLRLAVVDPVDRMSDLFVIEVP